MSLSPMELWHLGHSRPSPSISLQCGHCVASIGIIFWQEGHLDCDGGGAATVPGDGAGFAFFRLPGFFSCVA